MDSLVRVGVRTGALDEELDEELDEDEDEGGAAKPAKPPLPCGVLEATRAL